MLTRRELLTGLVAAPVVAALPAPARTVAMAPEHAAAYVIYTGNPRGQDPMYDTYRYIVQGMRVPRALLGGAA